MLMFRILFVRLCAIKAWSDGVAGTAMALFFAMYVLGSLGGTGMLSVVSLNRPWLP
jgi:hypothetical protein